MMTDPKQREEIGSLLREVFPPAAARDVYRMRRAEAAAAASRPPAVTSRETDKR